MAKAITEVNKDKKSVTPVTVKNTKKSEVVLEQEEQLEEQLEEQPKKTRGREKGFKVETPIAHINITGTPYRIDESDGRNKIIQKLTTKVRTKDEKDDDDNKGVKVGEEYTKYVNVLKCFRSNYKSAFFRLHEVMVEDEVGKRKEVSLEDFLQIYKDLNIFLDKTFPVKEE